ncbi:AGE family epimerase/isomerase [Paraburkholderia edwinii]|uniref:AGE family epimerase/isomerase n=1 Tax=Paraburkholderia edwinii TaxID=2861782 RepID=A0ABX8UTU1_9BURK|nr:AGE family epimerase/isomerase [Paraburkholderia edwinii]QYD72434.1 AGE family epimerase/isomerase [Paraburkholderia edwinii]
MSPSAPTTATALSLREHFARVVLPTWRGAGFNEALTLPYEALAADGRRPLPAVRYRAMACARQLFVFAQAGDTDHAQRLFEALLHYFQDKRHGGWFYSVDTQGAPLDTTKDLYTHAFVVFACAEYGARSGNRDAFDMVHRTSAVIEERFSVLDGAHAGSHTSAHAAKNLLHGLYHAALNSDFSSVTGAPLQNPLMHLTEAWLAARQATGDAAYDTVLERLCNAVARAFVHAPTGCIAELPIGSADNWLEPGHQFEWFWLVRQAGGLLRQSGLDELLSRAFLFAQQHGVDATTGGVALALDEQGASRDATQRIWAQSEYLRALAVHPDAGVRAALPRQIERFSERFLSPQGWHECKTAAGDVTRDDMPSTTPYHLATAYAAL